VYIKSPTSDTDMVYITYLTNVYGNDLWHRLALFGNHIQSVFMTTDNIIAVVLCSMFNQDLESLANQLQRVWLTITEDSDDIIERMMQGSNMRMKHFLLGLTFVPPPSNQRHLLEPLCKNAGLKMEEIAGSYSVAEAFMALQYVFAHGLVAIGAI
jgi:hypothetical protein